MEDPLYTSPAGTTVTFTPQDKPFPSVVRFTTPAGTYRYTVDWPHEGGVEVLRAEDGHSGTAWWMAAGSLESIIAALLGRVEHAAGCGPAIRPWRPGEDRISIDRDTEISLGHVGSAHAASGWLSVHRGDTAARFSVTVVRQDDASHLNVERADATGACFTLVGDEDVPLDVLLPMAIRVAWQETVRGIRPV